MIYHINIYIYISIKPQVLRRSFHQLLDPKYSTGTGSVHRHSTGDGVVLHGQQQTHCGAPQFGYCWFINPMVIYLYMVIWLVIWLYMVIWLVIWLVSSLCDISIAGWWLKKHLEKYESQWEGLSHIWWENKTCLNPPTSYKMLSSCNLVYKHYE